MSFSKLSLITVLGLIGMMNLYGQQRVDTLYNPDIINRAYKKGEGTVIHIDRGHRNFHTRRNRFRPFAKVLLKDGYQVVDYNDYFDKEKLKEVKILVISNALHQHARTPFTTPTMSAFTNSEIAHIKKWVKNGGSLFLIADHMPFAGASSGLAKAFGFKFYDSFVFDAENRGIFDFTIKNKMLSKTTITQGRNNKEKILQIRTFTGQGFKIPKRATSILNLMAHHTLFTPDTMWVFNNKTSKFSANKLSQGANMTFGKGRVVVFGEAAMFTGQLAGPNRIKVGMNSLEAGENYKLLLNIIHWLDRLY